MEDSTKKSRAWVFTLNNYTDLDIKQFEDLSCNYIKFGKECGTENTPHLQGFVIFKTQYRLSQLKKLNTKVHWEATNAKFLEHNQNYCGKDGNVYEKDSRNQGVRNDLKAVAKLVKEKGVSAVIDEMPEMYIKYHSGIEKLHTRCQQPRTIKPNVIWIYGETGVGKTRHVFDNHSIDEIWISNKNLQWWDGYENQNVVLIDDFRKDFCTFHELLRILDRYPYMVAVKGGFKQLNSEFIYITSPFSPAETYETREDTQQLLRRITKILKL